MYAQSTSKSHTSVIKQEEQGQLLIVKVSNDVWALHYFNLFSVLAKVMMHFKSGFVWKQKLFQFYLSQYWLILLYIFFPLVQNYLRQMLPIFSNSSFYQQYPLIDSNLTSHWSSLVGFKFIFTWPAFIYNSDSLDVSIIFTAFLISKGAGFGIPPHHWWIFFMDLVIRSWEERILIYFNDKWFTRVNKSWEVSILLFRLIKLLTQDQIIYFFYYFFMIRDKCN